jgi:predicted RNA binding protein YcfA (HicA-like mRNA interferase family)
MDAYPALDYGCVREARRTEVERFLRAQGYAVSRDTGRHTWWTRPASRPIPLPRHPRISPAVLRDVEQAVGFVPKKWK